MRMSNKKEKIRSFGSKLGYYALGVVVIAIVIVGLFLLFFWDGSWMQEVVHNFFHPWWKFVLGALMILILEAYPLYLVVKMVNNLKDEIFSKDLELDEKTQKFDKVSQDLVNTQANLKKFQKVTHGAVSEIERLEKERDNLRSQLSIQVERNRELHERLSGLTESFNALQSQADEFFSHLDEVPLQDDSDSAELPIEEKIITEPESNSDDDYDDIFHRRKSN